MNIQIAVLSHGSLSSELYFTDLKSQRNKMKITGVRSKSLKKPQQWDLNLKKTHWNKI